MDVGNSDRERNGTLYVVATPIGNLDDITMRAANVLRGVEIVAAEDTRRSRVLLAHIGATPARLVSLAAHNEPVSTGKLLDRLGAGHDVAVISDAGTPLLSDPGFELVRAARAAGIAIVPIPGASALTAALSVCPLPVGRFHFEGFLPAKASQRRRRLASLANLPTACVFFEAARRLADMLDDVRAIVGERDVFIAKEITKLHERFEAGTVSAMRQLVETDASFAQGEYVVVVAPQASAPSGLSEAGRELIRALCEELPPAQAARIAARCLDVPKAVAYEFALALKGEGG